jgi:hypothetical protein
MHLPTSVGICSTQETCAYQDGSESAIDACCLEMVQITTMTVTPQPLLRSEPIGLFTPARCANKFVSDMSGC